ncbi:DUF1822 family protein [Scytonema sp. NUACC26]|uniref:DUF1822 family protein n=1 Tax=Scytonema sp. NUACC26 TaxID=3140176 RepID=UPI0034DC6554
MTNKTEFLTYTGPIPPQLRWLAEKFCRQQVTQEKREQVRRNTLSVSFVNSYLQYMGFETDLEASDSWNPMQQILFDVADLELKNLGKLECRSVLEGEEFVNIPIEVLSNRIGYVVVQISKSFREAKLLGFVREVSSDLLLISELQSLEKLLDYLDCQTQDSVVKLNYSTLASSKNFINVVQWFENIFDTGWQEVEALLGTQPVYAISSLRSIKEDFVSRSKLINLGGNQTTEQAVVLVVILSPNNESELDIIVEVHPTSGKNYLPQNLQLMVLDFEGISVMEAQTRSTNKNIQLQFSAEVGERFSTKLVLGNISATENFVI